MRNANDLSLTIMIFSLFLLSNTGALSESDTHQKTNEKQNVQELESGRTNLLKRDTDSKDRTEEKKENLGNNVPRMMGLNIAQP